MPTGKPSCLHASLRREGLVEFDQITVTQRALKSASNLRAAGTGPIPSDAEERRRDDRQRVHAASTKSHGGIFRATIRAAPSLMPEALPAVTVPPDLNGAFNAASVSAEVSARGAHRRQQRRSAILIRQFERRYFARKKPASADAVRSCERRATDPAAREIKNSATFSAVGMESRCRIELASADGRSASRSLCRISRLFARRPLMLCLQQRAGHAPTPPAIKLASPADCRCYTDCIKPRPAHRLTVAGTACGSPASSAAMRATRQSSPRLIGATRIAIVDAVPPTLGLRALRTRNGVRELVGRISLKVLTSSTDRRTTKSQCRHSSASSAQQSGAEGGATRIAPCVSNWTDVAFIIINRSTGQCDKCSRARPHLTAADAAANDDGRACRKSQNRTNDVRQLPRRRADTPSAPNIAPRGNAHLRPSALGQSLSKSQRSGGLG